MTVVELGQWNLFFSGAFKGLHLLVNVMHDCGVVLLQIPRYLLEWSAKSGTSWQDRGFHRRKLPYLNPMKKDEFIVTRSIETTDHRKIIILIHEPFRTVESLRIPWHRNEAADSDYFKVKWREEWGRKPLIWQGFPNRWQWVKGWINADGEAERRMKRKPVWEYEFAQKWQAVLCLSKSESLAKTDASSLYAITS